MLCYVNGCLVLYYIASGGSSSAFLAMFFHVVPLRRRPLFLPSLGLNTARLKSDSHTHSQLLLHFGLRGLSPWPCHFGPSDGQNHSTECRTLVENNARVAAACLCARN